MKTACGIVIKVCRIILHISKSGNVKKSSGTLAKKPRRPASNREFVRSERARIPRTMRRGTKVAEDFLVFL